MRAHTHSNTHTYTHAVGWGFCFSGAGGVVKIFSGKRVKLGGKGVVEAGGGGVVKAGGGGVVTASVGADRAQPGYSRRRRPSHSAGPIRSISRDADRWPLPSPAALACLAGRKEGSDGPVRCPGGAHSVAIEAHGRRQDRLGGPGGPGGRLRRRASWALDCSLPRRCCRSPCGPGWVRLCFPVLSVGPGRSRLPLSPQCSGCTW